ncbi:MAG: hypothetical protein E6R05_05470 [Candidatus Moraniibacteriota bacterium]|nr:hypothetical protein [Planctomycetota bacterium]TXH01594.1 MAG: hypothetical protein E6R05_05470 [Candidatus Moranbacteria bacterium]
MRFTDLDIELAKAIKKAGFNWKPEPGHFVLDDDQVFHHASPFQDHVFFILDLQHFLRYTGSIDGMKSRLVWLPSWHDAREQLRKLGVTDALMAAYLHDHKAIENGNELEWLLRLWLEKITVPVA